MENVFLEEGINLFYSKKSFDLFEFAMFYFITSFSGRMEPLSLPDTPGPRG